MNDLFKACKNGDFDLVKSLLDKGADPNEDDYTPLDVAIENKHSKIANLLIEKGSDVNFNNPLYLATTHNLNDVVKKLIKKGANLNKQKVNGYTSLMQAINLGYFDIASILIQNGADVNIENKIGNTALMFAVSCKNSTIVNLLLLYGADVNKQYKDGTTLLIQAINLKYFDIVSILIKNGADFNKQYKYGTTALIQAINLKYFDIASILIQNGADVDIQDKFGNTALMFAVSYDEKSIDIVNLLLLYGADPYLKNINREDSFDLARPQHKSILLHALDPPSTKQPYGGPSYLYLVNKTIYISSPKAKKSAILNQQRKLNPFITNNMLFKKSKSKKSRK